MKPATAYVLSFWAGWFGIIVESWIAWGRPGFALAISIPLFIIGTVGGFLEVYCKRQGEK